MKDLITIGLPSKGRLKDKAISFFNDKGLKILQSEKERNYFGTIENENNIKIIFLHAKEIIQRLGDGTLDVGVSGLDLFKNKKNVFILRTFSKIYGLASLRIGWGYGDKKIISALNQIKPPFNINEVAQ